MTISPVLDSNIFIFSLLSVQEQHAGPSEAQSQAEEEEMCTIVRLPVQLVLLLRAHRPQGPASAQMGLWKTPGLMFSPHRCKAAVKKCI